MMNKQKTNNLYGLKRYSKINIVYDLQKRQVIEATGCNLKTDNIIISDEFAFSTPTHISINGIPFFPSKYDIINEGTIVYSSNKPPRFNIEITDDNFLNQRAIVKQNTIGIKDLNLFDINGRKRHLSQNQVMGESANAHAQRQIDAGVLKINPLIVSKIQWHWCHLIAFRMLPSEKSQKKNNLVCATSACNGHMTNIESAVKRFIYEFKRPLGLEVTATTYVNTSLARGIRYNVFDKKGSRMSYTEYFDALTDTKTDTLDHYSLYDKLVKDFNI